MYSPNYLAILLVRAASARGRSFLADERSTVVRLLPRLSGMVYVLAVLALRNYSVGLDA